MLGACVIPPAVAAPWIAPGDSLLRSDLQLLADAGVVRAPVSTWPLSWPDIAQAVLGVEIDAVEPALLAPLARVQRRARAESARGFSGFAVGVAGAHEPQQLRTFDDTPREEGEARVRASWMSEHLALNLSATAVIDPDDGDELRPDGSYLGVNIGNFMISAGYQDRWWGPGWEGSLVLSNNARPIPALALERNYSTPFETRWLSWLGPWRLSLVAGEAVGDDVEIEGVRMMGARLNFRPLEWLELGLSRTAQWCGDGRPCDASAFTDVLIGRDNRSESLDSNDEPGNQMAGYDLRIRLPKNWVPLAFYTQWIGEDEAGGLPSKFLGQLGIESWWASTLGSWRVHAEYADTACVFTRQTPQFNCGYRNSLYPQGYTYHGRVLGHPMDNDSRMFSLGASLVREGGDQLSALVRRVDLNRDGGPHLISTVPTKLNNVELRYSRSGALGSLTIGVGFDDADGAGVDSSAHGFLMWQQGI